MPQSTTQVSRQGEGANNTGLASVLLWPKKCFPPVCEFGLAPTTPAGHQVEPKRSVCSCMADVPSWGVFHRLSCLYTGSLNSCYGFKIQDPSFFPGSEKHTTAANKRRSPRKESNHEGVSSKCIRVVVCSMPCTSLSACLQSCSSNVACNVNQRRCWSPTAPGSPHQQSSCSSAAHARHPLCKHRNTVRPGCGAALVPPPSLSCLFCRRTPLALPRIRILLFPSYHFARVPATAEPGEPPRRTRPSRLCGPPGSQLKVRGSLEPCPPRMSRM